MYESFYGLKEKPFNLLPDPEYLFMSLGHENAYTHLEYAITENKGFVVITGEIGSGKTTLINLLLKKVPHKIQVGLINNPNINPKQFLKTLCLEFELDPRRLSKTEMLDLFNDFLLQQFADGNQVLLIIDEAQNLPERTIEEIRMLSNLETEKHHLIQIMLVGQPELKYKLQGRGLAQFVQRVTVHCHLEGLREDEVDCYIRHRLTIAGAADPAIFSHEAVKAVFQYSRGIPRLINTLCDTALVYGFADDLKVIDKNVIDQVVETREIGGISLQAEEAADTEPGPANAQSYGEMSRRLKALEKRISGLEIALAHVEQQTGLLVSSGNEKDRVILELTRMLRQNFESRPDSGAGHPDYLLKNKGEKEEGG